MSICLLCVRCFRYVIVFFFFNDTATTEIYTLSLHDALPISGDAECGGPGRLADRLRQPVGSGRSAHGSLPSYSRSEEHTSELQSRQYLVCRLLLEKKKKIIIHPYTEHISETDKVHQIHHTID